MLITDVQEAVMSPVVRQELPVAGPQARTLSLPQLQIANTIGRLVAESRRVRAWSPGPVPVSVDNAIRDGGAHAGWTETAVILALRSGTVRLDRAAAGPVEPLRRLMPALQAGGVRSVSPNGVLGDPSGATAEAGEKILAGWGRDLVAAVAGWPAPTAGPGAGG